MCAVYVRNEQGERFSQRNIVLNIFFIFII